MADVSAILDATSRGASDSENRTRIRAGKSVEQELPDGPVDLETQEDYVETFRRQQESQEVLFSSLLVLISLPLFLFFVGHSYWHLVEPWSFPFSGLKDADQLARQLASFAHVFTGLAVVSSFATTLAHKRLRDFRHILRRTACILVLLAGAMWMRVLLSLPAFPWHYAFFFAAVLVVPLVLQWYIVETWEDTRGEIRELEKLKYRYHTA